MQILKGKHCLVTGSTSGIGKEIANGLASLDADVIVVGRTESKCQQTLEEIKSRNPDKQGSLSYFVADLSSQEEARKLAANVVSSISALDVLVNNAGVFRANLVKTVDGIEYTFALNHLAPFLLTVLLTERLKAAEQGRVVTTSSIAHRGAVIDFDDIGFERRKYSGIRAYGQSKLANVLFTRELAKRLQNTRVTANCFHPGGVRTNLVTNGNPLLYRIVWAIASPFMLSANDGAKTGVYLASSDAVRGTTGKYFVKQRETTPSQVARDDNSAHRLWELSEKMTGLEQTK